MIQSYQTLRNYCQKHEWAAALSAVLLIALLGGFIAVIIEYHSVIGHWLLSDILTHGLIFIVILIGVSFVATSIFCLSHSHCSIKEQREKAIYRNKPVMTKQLRVIRSLGVNPRRQHKRVRIASS
ncbi:MAG: hypothetical protein EP297_06090 [Gammaproteobacteria bacterium]|nr:MAG: hypothetical protein EP297_06090 [Gammaproteobacteria bacterium]